jgi:hypothetical protein
MAFVIINCYLSWPPKLAPAEFGWDYMQLNFPAHEQWLVIGELMAAASTISLLVDLVTERRS